MTDSFSPGTNFSGRMTEAGLLRCGIRTDELMQMAREDIGG